MRIGVAGTGRMGTAIVRRLVETGHEVAVWNRSVENTRDAREAGARVASIPADLSNECEVVISFLLDDAAVERVYLGASGLLAVPVEGRLFIDMSTVTPGTHGRIAPAMALRGADFIECPVSGSVAAAQSGALVGFAGGKPKGFARAQPLLAQLCRRVEHIGPLGAGARMKLGANLLLAVFWQALGETLLVVDPPAANVARVLDLLADSNIGASILRTRSAEIVAALNGGPSRPATFDVDTLRKDLRYVAQEGAAHGSTLPLADRVLECFDRASRAGSGGVDGVAYPAYWLALQRTAGASGESVH